jgi:hypothetical protein
VDPKPSGSPSTVNASPQLWMRYGAPLFCQIRFDLRTSTQGLVLRLLMTLPLDDSPLFLSSFKKNNESASTTTQSTNCCSDLVHDELLTLIRRHHPPLESSLPLFSLEPQLHQLHRALMNIHLIFLPSPVSAAWDLLLTCGGDAATFHCAPSEVGVTRFRII